MLGFFLVAFGTSAEEVALSVGKKSVQSGRIGLYGLIALNMLIGIAVFGLMVILWPGAFVFSLLSLPFFLTRAFFEIIQMHVSMRALVFADRTTFSFVRTLTIPLLLVVDVLLGYTLSVPQIGGLLLLTIALLLIFSGKQFSKRAIGPVIFSSVNAVVTISLFKYDIAHFNSIAAEQIGMLAILFVYALIGRYVMSEPNPFGRVMKDRKILLQVTADAIGGVCQSFAFLYLPPSILMAVKRSTSVFWALLSGHFAFHEKHFLRKSLTVIMLISSLTLLIHGA